MKAEWLDSTDKHVCLCCGQLVYRSVPIGDRAEAAFKLFTRLGLTREDLLTKHREQIDFQSPGFSQWLEGH
jgi:hypothetical protein